MFHGPALPGATPPAVWPAPVSAVSSRLPALALLALAVPAARAETVGPFLDDVLDTGFVDEEPAPCSTTTLRDGVQLPPAPGLYKRWHPDREWGTPTMIEVLTTVAERMAWLAPDADPIVIGDISARGGGYLAGHRSHRGGIDADIGIYWGDGRQYQQGFIPVRPDQLDARTNWLLIRALFDTGQVERILLDRSLIRVIRDWTVESGTLTPAEARAIFPPPGEYVWNETGVVHHVDGHKHHMHVRLRCP